ncbi:hypothetical protein C0J52_21367 [Blattella germanica]|nr:hypothetical protein C0J52_21367 [Blattella germanica]
MRFLFREFSGPVVGDRPYLPAVKWTLQFQLENYLDSLYPDLHADADSWNILSSEAAEQYLPNSKESIQLSNLFMRNRVLLHPQRAAKEMMRFKLFQAEIVNAFPYSRRLLFELLCWVWIVLIYSVRVYRGRKTKVTAVSLCPHGDGRFLMTGSFDRTIKFWDLEDTTAPITVSKKGSVTDGAWLSHWVSASLSASDWMNAVAQGTQAGELTIISYTEMKELDKVQEDDENDFRHMPREARLWMRQSDKMKPTDVDTYPVSSINRVSWNPNCQSFLWLASGYQCGLLRATCIRAMNSHNVQEILHQSERKITAALNKNT